MVNCHKPPIMKKKYTIAPTILLFLITVSLSSRAQPDRWQQKVAYQMDIKMDVKNHQFKGQQELKYFNNSPDTLKKVYYHLYFNAFQPESMMDIRSRNIEDPDGRVGSRISKLKPNEIGYQKIVSLKQNGKDVTFQVVGTILEVDLREPIMPNTSVNFSMAFEAQVPVQIRRSGRNNTEGVDYSMSQWYPKMAEYDYMGWHPNPYIGREFHGVWGEFDIKITIDHNYTIGGTGYLQNASEIGHGYEPQGTAVPKHDGDITWHFKVDNVMDFMWAADPDYTHDIVKVPDGPDLHFLYIKDKDTEESWSKLPSLTVKAIQYINKRFGKYPYKQYSVIQGGDGGMEYPMATLITGKRPINGLLGVTVHELLHSWFQHLLGTNESLFAWMDEGFTSFATSETINNLNNSANPDPHRGTYMGYTKLVQSGREEPSSLHADHFNTNSAYSTSAYVKGSIFLNQLSYIVGMETFNRGMLRYFNTWKFKHPNPNDIIRIFENESGMVLDWYLNYWIYTTKTIDYAVKSLDKNGKKSIITLQRIGEIPMPLDVEVTYNDGSRETFYIPLRIMRNEKHTDGSLKLQLQPDWPWTFPEYKLEISRNIKEITNIQIDPSGRLADIKTDNNSLQPGS